MLVTQTADGWEIIYHRTHALLAAQLAGGFAVRGDPLRIAEIIVAIGQHDDLAREWEGELLTPAGAPLDFTLSSSDPSDVAPWQALIEGARYRSRWVALLTAIHVAFCVRPAARNRQNLRAFSMNLRSNRPNGGRSWLSAKRWRIVHTNCCSGVIGCH